MRELRWVVATCIVLVSGCSVLTNLDDLRGADDASVSAEADAPFCASVDATVCSDFDEDGGLDGWTYSIGGPTVWGKTESHGLVDAGLSPPNAMRVSDLDDAGLGCKSESYDYALGSKSRVTVDFDVRLLGPNFAPTYFFKLSFSSSAGPAYCQAWLWAYDTGGSLDVGDQFSLDGGALQENDLQLGYALTDDGAWHHVTLTVDQAAGTVSGGVDGDVKSTAFPMPCPTDQVYLDLGLQCYGGPPVTYYFDNVVINAQ